MAMVKSWLEDVPAEIRCMTYKHFFQSVKVEIHGDHKLVKRRKMSRRTATAILLTCKTVNKEADPYFFQEAEFVIKECHCWKKDPETRPRRLKEICYLTFATVPSEDYWVSLWWDLIWSKQEAQPTTSGIKVLKIAAACSAEDIEDIAWLFDCTKGRFEHVEVMINIYDNAEDDEHCKVIINKKNDVSIHSVYQENLEGVKGLLLDWCICFNDSKFELVQTEASSIQSDDEESE